MLSGGPGGDTIIAMGGNDVIAGGAGGDTLDGGKGNDTLDYSSATEFAIIDLGQRRFSGGDADGDTPSGFENVIAGLAGASLSGNDVANKLTGRADVDTFLGRGGNDVISGGAAATNERRSRQ